MLLCATIRLRRRGPRGAGSFRALRGLRHALACLFAGLALRSSPAFATGGMDLLPLDITSLGGAPGRFSFDLSYQQANLDKILARDQVVDATAVYATGGDVHTLSRVTLGQAAYRFGTRGVLMLTVPWVDRVHEHVTVQGLPEPELRQWEYNGLGDMSLIGSWNAYRVDTESPLSFGLVGGLKLATGRRHVPDIQGEEPEVRFRPGSGSTDVLLGLQILQTVALTVPGGDTAPATFFLTGLYTHTTEGTDGYRVGRSFEANFGGNYPIVDRLQILAQLDYHGRGPDHIDVAGAPVDGGHQHLQSAPPARPTDAYVTDVAFPNGDIQNSGGVALYLTPGVLFQARPWFSVSTRVQLPLYQRVNGTQSVSSTQFWLGATYRLP